MHIKFHSLGRERRCLFVNTPDEDLADMLQQAQQNAATPMQSFDLDIQNAAKNVLGTVDDAYTQKRSLWNPLNWRKNYEAANAEDARTGVNAVIDDLVDQAGVQAEKEKDKTFARIHALASHSNDQYFFHSLRLRALEQSLQEHRDRKVKLVKALQTFSDLCAQSGLPLDEAILAKQQERIESLDKRTVRYETLLQQSKETVDAQKKGVEFANLEAMEDKLRRTLLKANPFLADKIEQLIRGAIGGSDELIGVIDSMYTFKGALNAEGKEMKRIAKELGGRNTWFFIDRAKQNRAADYYSTRLVEKRELNPDDLGKRVTALRESRIGQRVRLTIGNDASTYILMNRPSDKQLQLQLVDGNGPDIAMISTDGSAPQLVVQDLSGGVQRTALAAPKFRAADDASMLYLAA